MENETDTVKKNINFSGERNEGRFYNGRNYQNDNYKTNNFYY